MPTGPRSIHYSYLLTSSQMRGIVWVPPMRADEVYQRSYAGMDTSTIIAKGRCITPIGF